MANSKRESVFAWIYNKIEVWQKLAWVQGGHGGENHRLQRNILVQGAWSITIDTQEEWNHKICVSFAGLSFQTFTN